MVHSSYNFSRFPGFRSIHRPQLGATIAASYIRGPNTICLTAAAFAVSLSVMFSSGSNWTIRLGRGKVRDLLELKKKHVTAHLVLSI